MDWGRAPRVKGGSGGPARDALEEEAAAMAREVPKPYTVPEGYKPPTLGEQFRYAARRHPYYRYGTAAAVLLGCLAWYAAASEHKAHGPPGDKGKPSGSGSSSSGEAAKESD